MSGVVCWDSRGPAQTQQFGQVLGRLLRAGDVIALRGPLGAGKTQLTKGIAIGLEVPADEPVVSPTFVLARRYIGRLRLHHLDAYRLRGADALLALGFDEMLDEPDAVVVIEWADHVAAALPPHAWWVELAHVGPRTRRLCLRVPDAQRHLWLAAALSEVGLRAERGGNPVTDG